MSTGGVTQFGRACKLLVSNGNSALDLSEFRIQFQVHGTDLPTPNMAQIRVYNLAASTVAGIINGYNSVLLQAGYNENFNDIFKGTIVRFKRGREVNVDSYLDLIAADGDEGYNFGVISQSFAAGSHVSAQVDALAASMGLTVDPKVYDALNNPNAMPAGGVLLRGKALYGMSRLNLNQIAYSCQARWSIQNGVLTFVPLTGYLSGDAVVINSQTGMIGVPEATDNGITVRTLLNPLIRIGCRVRLNESDVARYPGLSGGYLQNSNGGVYGKGKIDPFFPAFTTTDGFYRVMAVDHDGDTRGQNWYSNMICLAVDSTQPAVDSVEAYE